MKKIIINVVLQLEEEHNDESRAKMERETEKSLIGFHSFVFYSMRGG